ncbi:MAG: HNH endonuclease [Devosia sp.]
MFSLSRRRLAEHVAGQQGFELIVESNDDLLSICSSLVPGTLLVRWVEDEQFAVDVDLPLVRDALAQEFSILDAQGARARDDIELYTLMGRAFQLCMSLPDRPLQKFTSETFGLPSTTEGERLVLQRIGQGIFREALEEYWKGCCAITGIGDRDLLRASHIKPWAESTDSERLDVYNGILLAAHLDAAFDKHLFTISESGGLVLSTRRLGVASIEILNAGGPSPCIRLADRHQSYLAVHRARFMALEAMG